jgi:hypothetical protein
VGPEAAAGFVADRGRLFGARGKGKCRTGVTLANILKTHDFLDSVRRIERFVNKV